MKTTLAAWMAIALAVGASACGSTSKTANEPAASHSDGTTTSPVKTNTATQFAPAPAQTKADADHDNDVGASEDHSDNGSALDWAKPADTTDAQTIAVLLRRYYAAAAAKDGARGCSLLYSPMAEAVPEDYGVSPPGEPYLTGSTCPVVLTKYFKHFHPQISLEQPRLRVVAVRLEHHHGLAVLSFGKLPEREIQVIREGRAWRLASIFDSQLR